jgi:hypothetical protein
MLQTILTPRAGLLEIARLKWSALRWPAIQVVNIDPFSHTIFGKRIQCHRRLFWLTFLGAMKVGVGTKILVGGTRQQRFPSLDISMLR